MPTAQAPRRILIAGAGIGGLAAALACRRQGHHVQVFEKASAFAPLGAGIQLGPNVTRILHGWGLASALKEVATFPERLQVRDAQSGATLGQLRLGQNFTQRYGAPYATLHRSDLHEMLQKALQNQAKNHNDNDGLVELGHAVEGFDEAEDDTLVHLRLRTDDGRQPIRHGDLLIGADGLHSQVRAHWLAGEPLRTTGHVALRCLLRLADLPAKLRSTVGVGDVGVWLGPQLHVVHYPVRNPLQEGDWLNLVLIVESPTLSQSQDWSQTVTASELEAACAVLTGDLKDILSVVPAENWRKWNLFTRRPIRNASAMVQGRAALLGDAAHPMLPYLAQGGGMAIEDAEALANCLQRDAHPHNQLQAYAQIRWHRNARVQRRALRNGQVFHASGFLKTGRDWAMRIGGEGVLDMAWLYGA